MGIQINGNTDNITATDGGLSITSLEINQTGISTFQAGVNVSGGQLDVGSNIKLGNAGIITATSFSGSGANLTSLPAQATIANNADNRIITGGSGVNLNGEANLTFDGTTLQVQNSGSGLKNLLRLKNSNASAGVSGLYFNSTTSGSAFDAACVRNGVNGSGQGRLYLQTNNGSGLVNGLEIEYDGQVTLPTNSLNILDSIVHIGDTNTKIRFPAADTITAETAGSERIRIRSGGEFAIGGSGYAGQPFSVQTSGNNLGYMQSTGTTRAVMNFVDGNSSVNNGYGCIGNNHVFMKDGSEKVRIDSSGRLLIGSTDGATYSEDWSDDLIVGSTANGKNDGITILSGTSQNGSLAFADSGGASRGLVGYVHNGDYLRFHAGNTLKARIDTDGLKFNSDTAAANALSDYEEGTFTPTNSIGMTLTNNQTARYTKIGRMVYIQLDISFSGANDSSQCGLIQSLPFTSDSSSGNNTHGALQYVSEGTNSGNTVKQDFDNENMLLQIQPNESRIDIITLTNGVRKTRAFLHGRRFRISMWYPAAT
tara:strand:- start:43 stop:1659 length:1617 start_codon:yes stop_codon:yes gene_type:complete